MLRLQGAGLLLLPFLACSAAAAIYVPAGLDAGDTYHLVFVTSATGTAGSGNIDVYNNFVQGLADTAGIGISESVTWRAIGSTATVDANVNAPVSAPVYLLNGLKVADDYSDMWDGSIDNPINVDESGSLLSTQQSVWTGTKADGTADGWHLGNYLYARFGSTDPYYAKGWIEGGSNSTSFQYRYYGLSEQLTVPGGTAIPEPSTGVVFTGLLAMGLLGHWWRRRAPR